MSKSWHIENEGAIHPGDMEGCQHRIWLFQGYDDEEKKLYGHLYEVYSKVSHSAKFVALNFARFMRRNPHWSDECPIDFRYVTEDIGGTNTENN